MKSRFYLLTLISIFLFNACESTTSNDSSSSVTTVPNTSLDTGNYQAIILQSNDMMKFDLSEIRVKEGIDVVLTLKHTGKLPLSSMGHNFVLLHQGVDLAEFGKAAGQAKSPFFKIPEEIQDDVIAATEMIGGGEETQVRFSCPPKGIYDFLCSFPGHYGVMNGKFIVE